ncbi:MAG: DUF2723 domain-containing protein [Kiritimatiellae bacterium]|nr:DUF2723 domain-containing protein [Kiritimatiellia bacterium]
MDNFESDLKAATSRKPFFRRIDWASFLTATVISFVVYFLTLGPTVSLEDSGELAVAGDHLGVPHPPGYPIWTMISYVFARVFSFVTFRGQPTPAWSIALGSAVFGALAAGCTAMLITRSSSDMLRTADDSVRDDDSFRENLASWACGVAGSLIFAFSPVMWSQSTIVEVYALGAFFLMLVMLLTYRWMRQPSDKVLWLTAFVFGLGLTNYQVLLLAALPLIVIIFLRNVALFRDFLLVLIPFGLGALILKLGSQLVQPGLKKLLYLDLDVVRTYSEYGSVLVRNGSAAVPVPQIQNGLVVAGVAVFCLALLALAFAAPALRRRASGAEAGTAPRSLLPLVGGVFGFAVVLVLLATLFTHTDVLANPANHVLLPPAKYAVIGACLLAAVALCAVAAVFGKDSWDDPLRLWPLVLAGIVFLAVLGYASISIPAASSAYQTPDPAMARFDTRLYSAAFFLGALLLLGLSLTTPRGICFALPVAIVETVAYVLVLKGAALGLTHPSTWWFCAPVVFNFVVLLLAALALPNGVRVAMTVLCGELGVSFYAFMPIVSDLRNPPMNWGYPRTWEGFKHAITRGQYEAIKPTAIFAPKFLKQLGGYFTDLRTQFTLLIAPFGFLPFAAWRFRADSARKADKRGVVIFLALVAAAFFCWGIDGWAEAEAISDKTGGFLRGLAVLLLLASICAGVWARIEPLLIAALFILVAFVFVVIGEIPGIERIVDVTRIDKLAIAGLLLSGAVGGVMLVFRKMEESAEEMLKSHDVSRQVTVSLVLAGIVLIAVGFVFKTLQAIFVWSRLKSLCGGNADVAVSQWDKIMAAKGNVAAVVSQLLSSGASNAGQALERAISSLLAEQKITAIDVDMIRYMSRAAFNLQCALLAIVVVSLAIFALHILYRRRTIKLAIDDVTQEWLIGVFTNFFVMSFVLIVLANPKGDLQDSFIQKVKFIASHGLFALLIGYGFVFALTAIRRVAASLFGAEDNGKPAFAGRAVFTAAVGAVLLSSAIPIYENYFNDRLVFELGGAEQNGHDYGWQFGNYQLRGADAITEELEADEEPLPNPSYPPAMGENAVFFGGTDPGRFVPTYMIYSADVRPDVFLITQNALADNTFMSVTRDLYADANRKEGERPGLWIPTPDDSADAFQIYVKEVQSGKRPANADLKIENGRVQVVGALGVMEINGILCDMIFKRNKQWHDFFVEESYVIPWMYPYLTPHGLIMKINSERTPVSQANTNDDLDFWDWYTRRITRDRKYRRDIVAQKSFSKLRSAIAGLYMARGRIREAEKAYSEARILYPVSPEANFRMVQDVFLRQGRYEEALEYVDYFCEKDPNNERGSLFRDYISDTMALQLKLDALRAKYPDGARPSVPDAIAIATCYRQLGMNEMAAQAIRPYVGAAMTAGDASEFATLANDAGDAHLAAQFMDKIANLAHVRKSVKRLRLAYRIYAGAGDYAKMSTFLDLYLEQSPRDAEAWIDRATLALATGNSAKAEESLLRALAADREKAVAAIEKDPKLLDLAQEAISRRQRGASGVSLPGF